MVRKNTKDRCTGHCCRNLTIPISPEELLASYQRWHGEGKVQVFKSTNTKDTGPVYVDIHLLAPMLEYLGKSTKPYKTVNPTDEQLLGTEPERHRYRCKMLDREGNCSIYEIRPAMCRDYPYAGDCLYAQCTWKARKQKKETAAQTKARKRRLVIDSEGGLVSKKKKPS